MPAHLPRTRVDFGQFCLRQLGAPVIKINVTEEQIDDCIEMGLRYYEDYHFDGSLQTYLKHAITAENIETGYIDVADNVIGISHIFELGMIMGNSNNMFSLDYQVALQFAHDLTNLSTIPYVMQQMQMQHIRDVLVGKQPIRFNRHHNRLYIDANWQKMVEGSYIILAATVRIDPDQNPDVWSDRWLAKYVTAKIKYIWGSNLSKFDGLQMPGGVQYNGTKIQDDAMNEITDLENAMLSDYSMPPMPLIG